jgi:hypothetical protein
VKPALDTTSSCGGPRSTSSARITFDSEETGSCGAIDTRVFYTERRKKEAWGEGGEGVARGETDNVPPMRTNLRHRFHRTTMERGLNALNESISRVSYQIHRR